MLKVMVNEKNNLSVLLDSDLVIIKLVEHKRKSIHFDTDSESLSGSKIYRYSLRSDEVDYAV